MKTLINICFILALSIMFWESLSMVISDYHDGGVGQLVCGIWITLACVWGIFMSILLLFEGEK